MDDKVKATIITGVVTIIGYAWITWPPGPLVDDPPVISDLIPSLPSGQPDGTNITWTAIAEDPEKKPIKYKFELNGPSTGYEYKEMQNWSPKSDWAWKPTYSDIGTNLIRVWVKDEKGQEGAPHAENYSITNRGPGEIIYSNYTKMYIYETYPFMACVALNDSVDTAQDEITRHTHAIDESLIASADERFEQFVAAKRDFETAPHVSKSEEQWQKTPEDMSVNLNYASPSRSFEIYLRSNKTQKIPKDDPPHNYARWIWDVTPIREGTHDLILTAYDAENHQRKAYIPITVNVNPETVEEEVVEEEEPVELAEEEGGMPGFEAVFSITGLLAVSYLVLRRRE